MMFRLNPQDVMHTVIDKAVMGWTILFVIMILGWCEFQNSQCVSNFGTPLLPQSLRHRRCADFCHSSMHECKWL
jgi:hypothetical protein